PFPPSSIHTLLEPMPHATRSYSGGLPRCYSRTTGPPWVLPSFGSEAATMCCSDPVSDRIEQVGANTKRDHLVMQSPCESVQLHATEGAAGARLRPATDLEWPGHTVAIMLAPEDC